MHNQFREAFGSVHATEQMKQHTCAFLHHEMVGRQCRRRSLLHDAAVFCMMFAVVLCGIGGYCLYVEPVSYISVDVNPSVELGLNRFDRVVTVAAYNDDGAAVLQNLRLKNRSYTEAIELLLADDTFGSYLTEEALLSFTVVSENEEELLRGIRQCHGYAQTNAECHGARAQLVEEAHHHDLSLGKYQAFLELSRYDTTITADDCKSLSMRQIRDLISQYQSSMDDSGGCQKNGQDSRHHEEERIQGNSHDGIHEGCENKGK